MTWSGLSRARWAHAGGRQPFPRTGRRRAERSHQKLAENFLGHGAWRRHGREVLDHVIAERPELYFQAMVRLTEVMHRQLPELPEFDRRRYRADVLQRLQ
jgi:hypothetical protein